MTSTSSQNSSDAKEKGFLWPCSWQKLPAGGVIPEGGTSSAYETGAWRTFKPIWYTEVCTHCLLCWVYCPDSAILVENGRVIGIAYEFCKGCGVCVHECPKEGVLEMVSDAAPAIV